MKQTGNFKSFLQRQFLELPSEVLWGVCPCWGVYAPPLVHRYRLHHYPQKQVEPSVVERSHRGVGPTLWLSTVIKILLLESSDISGFCESMLHEDLRDSVCGLRRSDSISLLNISSSAASANKACFKHTHPPKMTFIVCKHEIRYGIC